MKKKYIDEYHQLENEKGVQIAEKLLTNDYLISDPAALYPEYLGLDLNCGLHRPGVNLGSLLFLFPKVIAYVPPMCRADFPKRYGIDFESFLFLSDPTLEPYRFIYPVLNHPKYYVDKTIRLELSPILKRLPPTWERWHQALRTTGGTYWFDLCDSLVDYKNIIQKSDIRSKWENDFPSRSKRFIDQEIKQQIRNKFTDLCLIGEQEKANELALLSKSDPHLFIADLSYLSEFLAYPKVLGAGGTLNFVTPEPDKYFYLVNKDIEIANKLSQIFDSKIVETLLNGLKFDKIPIVFRLDFLVDWHKNKKANIVRQAYQKLLDIARSNKIKSSELHQIIDTIVSSLRDFCESSYSDPKYVGKIIKERQTIFIHVCTFSGILIGLFGLVKPALAFPAFVGSSLAGILAYYKITNRERVEKKLIKKYFPSLSYELVQDAKQLNEFRKNTVIKLIEGKIDRKLGQQRETPVHTSWVPKD